LIILLTTTFAISASGGNVDWGTLSNLGRLSSSAVFFLRWMQSRAQASAQVVFCARVQGSAMV